MLHDFFCLKERCPFCHGQLATCDCIYEVLGLSPEERRAVEEYENDSVEPLEGIMERWKLALNEKGRIPYQPRRLGIDPDGLIYVSAKGYLPFIRKLLAEGVPVDATNEVAHTPLMAAAWNSRVKVVSLLLSLGADVHRSNDHGFTPLHCAVSSPSSDYILSLQAECVQLLLEGGALPNVRDKGGSTPLMKASWFGCTPSVVNLLRAGADSSVKNDRGRSAEDLARERGHNEIVNILSSRHPQ